MSSGAIRGFTPVRLALMVVALVILGAALVAFIAVPGSAIQDVLALAILGALRFGFHRSPANRIAKSQEAGPRSYA